MSDSASGPSFAPQACASCRRQKRKCDKALPSCGLCVRIARECEYDCPKDDASGSNGVGLEDFARLVRQVQGLEARIMGGGGGGEDVNGNGNGNRMLEGNGFGNDSPALNMYGLPSVSPLPQSAPSGFPNLFFLDSQMFDYERLTIQPPMIRVPAGALHSLGSSGELRTMIERYFDTTHVYFPIVSKIRLYQHLANPTHEPGADIALLFLAMKLVSTEIDTDAVPQTSLYQSVKSFYTYVEAQNGFSIQLIQAALLIALYELGHAVYPAAYLTIGHCARLGYSMGIHERGVPQMLPRPYTWTEQEERRRVWWAVVVLDRFVNLGHRGKPFASADPHLEAHLPTDDACWDRGEMLVATPLALSASQTTRASLFARICQAGHLIGKVIQHIDDGKMPLDYRFDQALQLHRTTRSLVEAMLGEEMDEMTDTSRPPSSAVAMGFSALLTLYDKYSCTEPTVENAPETQLVMQQESLTGLSEITELALQMARRVRTYIETEGLSRISPLTVDALYQAAANYAWYVRENSSFQSGVYLAELREVLNMVNARWRAAGECLRIVEATEFHLATATR